MDILKKYYFFIICILFSSVIFAEENIIRIYQDADLSNHIESSKAIQMGIEIAFNEINNQIGDYKVEFKYLDHRGNVIRSKQNFQTFLDDPNGLAIYSGIHSPPLIKNRDFINENQALTLVPWAAGGPITRYPSEENWIFRLSIDDTRAGPVIIDYAMNVKQCKSPHLLLESSPWGDSNLTNMSSALKNYNISSPQVTRFSWNIKAQGARLLLRDIISNGADCIILVANAIEGATIAQAIIDIKTNENLKLISHWGITGGDFHETIPSKQREKIDLSFIQTCFAFTNSEQTEISLRVFEDLKNYSNGTINSVNDLESAVGFIHAYDLSKILIAAIQKIELSGDINKDRNQVRMTLENLPTPIEGLIKRYSRPFSTFDISNNFYGHEALDQTDYCMARYGKDDQILINKSL